MQPSTCEADDRAVALRHCQEFCERLLPATLLRMARWKGLPATVLLQGLDDLRQELALDCLTHATTIAQLEQRPLRQRWLRHVDRFVYGNLMPRGLPLPQLDDPRLPCAPPPALPASLPLPELAAMNNGRANVAKTAVARGGGVRSVKRQLVAVAEGLDRGTSYHRFWRHRTTEALIGLAADLLRDNAQLVLLPRSRTRPDPSGRRQRLRQLVGRFLVQPSTLPERALLRRWCRTKGLDARAARPILRDALELAPDASAGWLWLFEACLFERDLPAAAQALRRAKSLAGSPPLAIVLARARLLEARGRWSAACALLVRAARRHPREEVLQQLCKNLAAPDRAGRQ